MKKLIKILNKLPKPEIFSEYKIIKPDELIFDLIARLKCYTCGGVGRFILCPSYLKLTYPQFETLELSMNFVNSFDHCILFIWKNDGTKSWKINKKDLSHIDFKVRKGRQLKGCEMGQSRETCQLMVRYKRELKQLNKNVFALLQGHCDKCGIRCPNRDHPPCRRNGLPSLEAIGIDVYATMEKLGIEYEYPVINELTTITAILM